MSQVPPDVEKYSIQRMVDIVLQQTNLMAQLPEILYAVEEDLATQYSEDELTSNGNIYVVYRALNDWVLSPELEVGLTESQKAYLLGLAKGGDIGVSIVRRNCELNEVSIPLEFKNAVPFHTAKFIFTLNIETDLDASLVHHVKGNYSNISPQDFCKVVEALQAPH
jgi:hypothetical protein